MYGPVLYCVEGIDNNVNLHRLYFSQTLNAKASFCEMYRLNKIEVDGFLRKTSDRLYANLSENFEKHRIKLHSH